MANIIADSAGNSFIVGDYIDKGSFSKVYRLECCLNKRQLAGKFISKEKLARFGITDKVWEEIKIHQVLRHKNIVQFLNFIDREKDIVIIMEYCSKYSMVHILHELQTFTLNEAKYFMIQIVSAVDYLHKNCVVHRDLKLGNLFVNKNLVIKLGDFGLAVTIEHEGQKRFSRCGTPNYLAPEVINSVGHSYEVDIWALGCILYTMLEGTPPFQGKDTTDTYNNILKGRYRFSPTIDFTAKAFIMSCLQSDPMKRPPIALLLNFEFLASTEIVSEAPSYCFGKDNSLILSRKRIQISEQKLNPRILTFGPHCKEHPFSSFFKLFLTLRYVKKWSGSTFGEFLSEHCSHVPLVWVNSWIDYSNTYGFAYQLSNTNCGVIFNDDTRMLYQKDEGVIHYNQRDNSVVVCQKDKIPEALKKKVKILVSCQSYMDDLLLKAHEAKISKRMETNGQAPAEVFKWVRASNDVVVIMFLTNGSVQLNFACDHTKLILCGITKTLTVIESPMFMKTLKLEDLQKYGCGSVLKEKLFTALKHIYRFLTDKQHEKGS